MPRNQAQTSAKPRDLYTEHRCVCGHLVYATDEPGDSCRWAHVGSGCPCSDHRVPGGES